MARRVQWGGQEFCILGGGATGLFTKTIQKFPHLTFSLLILQVKLYKYMYKYIYIVL